MSSKKCSIMYKNRVICLKNAIHPVNFPCALTSLTSRASRLSLPSSTLSLVFGLAPAFANEPPLRLWPLTSALDQHSRPSTSESSPKRADKAEQMPGCGRTARAARVTLLRLALLEPSKVGRQRVPGGNGSMGVERKLQLVLYLPLVTANNMLQVRTQIVYTRLLS